jgi:hypothetical protein
MNQKKADILIKRSQMPKERPSKRIKCPDEVWLSSEDVNDLPSLPYLCVLTKPHATISGTDPKTLSSIISKYIYSISGLGRYDDEKMSAVISTMSRLKFSINLYKNCSEEIVVEMSRISGDAIEYHRLAQDILRVAKGQKPRMKSISSNIFDRKVVDAKLLTSCMKLESNSELEANDATCIGNLERILTLITKDRFDAVTLGLESLELMTNELSTRLEHRIKASRAVLLDGTFQGIKDFVFSRVLEAERDDDRDEDEVASELRLVLIILINSLRNCKDDERLVNSDTRDLFTGLVRLMKGDNDPHNVNRIAVSIEILLNLSEEFVSLGKELGLSTLVARCDFGDLLVSVDVVKSIVSFF